MRLPNQFENRLFRGSIAEPKPGNSWIIFLFDGIRISAISYRYSPIWGLHITGTAKDKELKIIEKINQLNPDPKKLKQYVEFGNCPPLNIGFEDWVQSAGETINETTHLLARGRKCTIVILSSHPFWAGNTRMSRLYKKLGINPDTLPGGHLVSEVGVKDFEGSSGGTVPKSAAVDQNYFLYVIKWQSNRPIIIKKNIFQENTPLEFAQNCSKNRSLPVTVIPFAKEAKHYDFIITKNKGNENSLVAVYRVRTEQNPIKLYARFEPGYDIPRLIIPGIKDVKILDKITAVPSICMRRDQKPLQVVALIDATMTENLLTTVKAKLIEGFGFIARENSSSEFGLIVYGDYSEGSFRETEFAVKYLATRFHPITEWIKTCEKELTRAKPADFMSALDKGLSRLSLFPWKEDAQKYLLLFFCHPPHPRQKPDRDIYKSPFTLAENDWYALLKPVSEKKNINVFALYQPKEIKGEKAAEITQEIEITCRAMKKIGNLEQGFNPLEKIVTSMIKQTVGDYRLHPGIYHIPIAVENEP
jgi:hypothetical protein